MLFHYCTQKEALLIRKQRVIQPFSFDLLGAQGEDGPGRLEPVVCLSQNDTLENSVLWKSLRMASQEVPEEERALQVAADNFFWRFGVDDALGPLDLRSWAELHGYSLRLFDTIVMMATSCRADWRQWRLTELPIPEDSWRSVEVLDMLSGDWLPPK